MNYWYHEVNTYNKEEERYVYKDYCYNIINRLGFKPV